MLELEEVDRTAFVQLLAPENRPELRSGAGDVMDRIVDLRAVGLESQRAADQVVDERAAVAGACAKREQQRDPQHDVPGAHRLTRSRRPHVGGS